MTAPTWVAAVGFALACALIALGVCLLAGLGAALITAGVELGASSLLLINTDTKGET